MQGTDYIDWRFDLHLEEYRKTDMSAEEIKQALADWRQRDDDLLSQWPAARGLIDDPQWRPLRAYAQERGV